jgi:hypothetical protein
MSPFVKAYAPCRLDPESVSRFIVEKCRWVSTALLTLEMSAIIPDRKLRERSSLVPANWICAPKHSL